MLHVSNMVATFACHFCRLSEGFLADKCVDGKKWYGEVGNQQNYKFYVTGTLIIFFAYDTTLIDLKLL